MQTIRLGDKEIGPARPVYVIAEIGGNFTDYEQGQRLIDLAKQAGCDAVKFQTFRADTLTTRTAMFDMENTGKISQWELFRKYEIGEDLHRELFAFAGERGIFSFSTPSHPTDIDMLERLDAPAYKIGSDDAVNLPLLKYAAGTGKPVLLSTGMCTLDEIRRSVDAVREEGNEQIVLFQCTSSYPTHPEDANLLTIPALQQEFEFPVGFSDHTLGIDACYTAAVLGARVLEFHFTYDKKASGPDHMLSKEPGETAHLVRQLQKLTLLLGHPEKRPTAGERVNIRNNRKSIVVTSPIKSGEKFSPENIAIKRPGSGIPCEFWYDTIGKTAARDLEADQVLTWEDVG